MNNKVKISKRNKSSENMRMMANKIFENKLENTPRIIRGTYNWHKLT